MALANRIENEEVVGDMQSLPPVAKNTVKYVYEKVYPETYVKEKVLDGSPIEFNIPGRDDSFIDVKVRL